jgi:CDP-glucose 4,6-dehydratase
MRPNQKKSLVDSNRKSINHDFWRGKRVLLTGHTGFKGGWLALWLTRLGANVTGVALPPDTSPNLFGEFKNADLVAKSVFIDIRDAAAISKTVHDEKPEIVFHLAAQSLVRESYRNPVETFATNVMGTVNLLDALRVADDVRSAVIVTTDKVYANKEWAWAYREIDRLGGHDPYSASKAASEIVIDSYRRSFLKDRELNIASARAGNVIGGGDWSADRLIPDAVRAWQQGQPLKIRRPDAVRPWQHVLEPLAGYLILAEQLWWRKDLSESYNFGPQTQEAATVRAVIDIASASWGDSAKTEFYEDDLGPHEAGLLCLDTSRSQQDLGINPRWTLDEAITRSIRWYRQFSLGMSAQELCNLDLDAYEAAE